MRRRCVRGYHAAVPTALTLLLFVVLAVGCGPQPPPRNLLVIVIDTLRGDALGLYGAAEGTSPNIDSLAEESLVFDRAFAQGTYTPSSFMSYMTSTWVRRHGWDYLLTLYPDSGVCGWDDLETLSEVLQRNGFSTSALVSNHRLHPKLGFARGFDFWNLRGVDADLPDKQKLLIDAFFFGDPQVVRGAIREIDEWQPKQRNFLYVHLMAPHLPLEPSPEAVASVGLEPDWAPQGKVTVRMSGQIGSDPTPEQRKMVLDGYRASVHDGDRDFGRILDALDQAGHRDDTVVAFFSDHGEGMWEHDEYGHSRGVWEGLAHVPLMLRAAGIEPSRVRDHAVALIDVAPTLLSLLGIREQPESWQGRNLLAPGDGRPVFTERFGSVGITIDGRIKAFFSPSKSAPGWSVFDLDQDPGEVAPIDAPRQQREFAIRWLRWNAQNPKVVRDRRAEPVGLCREMTEEDRKYQDEALRALGYLQ